MQEQHLNAGTAYKTESYLEGHHAVSEALRLREELKQANAMIEALQTKLATNTEEPAHQ